MQACNLDWWLIGFSGPWYDTASSNAHHCLLHHPLSDHDATVCFRDLWRILFGELTFRLSHQYDDRAQVHKKLPLVDWAMTSLTTCMIVSKIQFCFMRNIVYCRERRKIIHLHHWPDTCTHKCTNGTLMMLHVLFTKNSYKRAFCFRFNREKWSNHSSLTFFRYNKAPSFH